MNTIVKEYLSPREVADILGIHPVTVRRWIASGQLKAVRIGRFKGRWFIHRSELDNRQEP